MLNVRQRRALDAQREILDLVGEFGEHRLAAVLNVHVTTVRRWAQGLARPPKAALIALHALCGRLPGMELQHWRGWVIGRDGNLYTPAGQAYSAGDILAMQYERALLKALQNRVRELEDKLAKATFGGITGAANDGDLSVKRA